MTDLKCYVSKSRSTPLFTRHELAHIDYDGLSQYLARTPGDVEMFSIVSDVVTDILRIITIPSDVDFWWPLFAMTTNDNLGNTINSLRSEYVTNWSWTYCEIGNRYAEELIEADSSVIVNTFASSIANADYNQSVIMLQQLIESWYIAEQYNIPITNVYWANNRLFTTRAQNIRHTTLPTVLYESLIANINVNDSHSTDRRKTFGIIARFFTLLVSSELGDLPLFIARSYSLANRSIVLPIEQTQQLHSLIETFYKILNIKRDLHDMADSETMGCSNDINCLKERLRPYVLSKLPHTYRAWQFAEKVPTDSEELEALLNIDKELEELQRRSSNERRSRLIILYEEIQQMDTVKCGLTNVRQQRLKHIEELLSTKLFT